MTHLKSGDRVRIGGLAIVEVKDRPARAGRNPATGEAIQIAASKKVVFRAAKELNDALRRIPMAARHSSTGGRYTDSVLRTLLFALLRATVALPAFEPTGTPG